MKPKELLSFLKKEIDYNNQIIDEASLAIEKENFDAASRVGFLLMTMLIWMFGLIFCGKFFSFEASILLCSLPVPFFIFHQTSSKKSLFSKIKNNLSKKMGFHFNLLLDENKTRFSKVSDKHLNQIKLSLTLDQYKALYIKYPNPCYEDVINFLENIDDINASITHAEESKYMFISTKEIKELKDESVQNVAHL